MRTSGRAACLASVTAVCLALAASALAWRHPTPSERSAITRVASDTPTASHKKVRVSAIRVSTAGPWASAQVAVYFGKQPDYATDILHQVHGKWIVASTGTAGEGCVMPRKDQQSLGLYGYPCRMSSLSSFLSPDRKVWCGVGSTQSFCVTGGGAANGGTPPQSGATLTRAGKVTICSVAVPSISRSCTQNWDSGAPVLMVGQETERDGVLCKSGTDGITCTLASGPGKGKGFLISSTTVRRVGP
jgi:hypothetical protein